MDKEQLRDDILRIHDDLEWMRDPQRVNRHLKRVEEIGKHDHKLASLLRESFASGLATIDYLDSRGK